MNRNKQIHLWVGLILFTALIVAFVPTVSAQDIHVLMVIDNGNLRTRKQHDRNRDNIGSLMKTEVANMLEKNRPGAMVIITELHSEAQKMTKDNILNWIQNLNPGTNDVVLVYYSGSGGVVRKDTYKSFLHVQEQILYRKELAKAVEELNCRLKILITETVLYSSIVQVPISIPPSGHREQVDFKHLFLDHEGFLDLTSTSLGAIALGDEINGGYFTAALMDMMMPQSIEDVDRNGDGFVSWEEVFEGTKKYTEELFKMAAPVLTEGVKRMLQRIGQTTQTPEVLSDFPKRIH